MRDIVLTNRDIYLHGNSKKKFGSGMKTNNVIKRMTSQVNNPSTGIAGLGTETNILSRSAFKPSGTSIMYGGSISSQLSKINFNTNKRDRNVRLKL
jgi:3-deoxy-D-arabino-heptulosonate 7-phosphate (DAHP) synthase